MKKLVSRILSGLLVLALFVGVLPTISVPVQAATINQQNIAARADYIYDTTWVCKKTTTCCAYGSYYTFNAGETYRIPYGQNTYTGAYIGYGVSVDTFLAAAADANSVYYNSRGTNSYNGYYSFYYATDCSGFVSYCWDATYKQSTRSLASISTKIGSVTTHNCTYNLQLGDALNKYDVHVVLVSGLSYDSNGAITQIEITESTIPTIKRTYYTPAQLASKYGSYDGIYRYYGNVDAPPSREGWVQDNTGRRYKYADGTYATGWKHIDGNWYYFSPSTYMFTGWYFDEGYQGWYFFDTSTGIMKTGFYLVDGYHYYSDSSGRMLTGWQKIDGYWYYLNTTQYWPQGAMFTGWHDIDGEIYFFSENNDSTRGRMQTGWVNVNGDWYYCNENGIRQYGWQTIDGVEYYLDETTGRMAAREWLLKDGVYCYHNASGAATEGAVWRVGDTYAEAVDIGTEFYGTIDIPATGTRAGVDSDANSETYRNLEVQAVREPDAPDYNEQLWGFQRREDGSYRITNVATGLCLDLMGGYVDKGTNVRVWTGNDAIAQRWFFFQNGSGYGLVSACNAWDKTVLDIADGLAAEGTNIRIWEYNGSGAQRFTVTVVDCDHKWSDGACEYCLTTCAHAAHSTGGICTTCSAAVPHSYTDGFCACGLAELTLTPRYPALSFEDEVFMNVYYSASNVEDVEQMGLLTWSSSPENGTVENAETVVSGFRYDDGSGLYCVRTLGIPAKMLSDTIYFKVYAKTQSGTYIYSRLLSYSPRDYADTILTGSYGTEVKALMVAMLNYGAAAQEYFQYRTDDLANDGLTAEQKAMVRTYGEDMIPSIEAVDSSKVGIFSSNGGFSRRYPSVSFEGAFCINYHFTPSQTPGSVPRLYYWTQSDYENAAQLTPSNATGMLVMSGTGEYTATVSGIAAKDLAAPIYVAGGYNSDGSSFCTGVLAYSIGSYCADLAASDNPAKSLAEATAVYGYYAKLCLYK